MIASPLNTYLPGLESVSYPPKKINTVAVKVTRENIGALSIELEAELMYFGTGMPHFYMDVERSVGEEKTLATLEVNVGDWIVVLWDEYRLFQEAEFMNTFDTNSGNSHELSVDHGSAELLERREEGVQRGVIHDDLR